MIKTTHTVNYGGSSPKKECSPIHPDAPLLGGVEGFMCNVFSGIGMTPSTDPTAKGQSGQIERNVDKVSATSATAAVDISGLAASLSPVTLIVAAVILLLILRR